MAGYAANSAGAASVASTCERPTARRIAETGVFENDSMHKATFVVGACSTIEITAAAFRGSASQYAKARLSVLIS